MRTLHRSLAVAALCAATLIVPTAAQASNPEICVFQKDGDKIACAKYIDNEDRLCVIKYGFRYETPFASAFILNGQNEAVAFKLADSSQDDGWVCTRNLSIPEDKQYRLNLDVKEKDKTVSFYS